MCHESRNWLGMVIIAVIISASWCYQSYIQLQIEQERTRRVLSLDNKQVELAKITGEVKGIDVK